jgi:hypothetical protein
MLQVAPHIEPTHVAIPLAGVLHAWLHMPQLAGLVLVSTQAAPHKEKP